MVAKKEEEISKLTKEKEECSRFAQEAQKQKNLMVERLGEEKYLKSLLEKLDVTPDMNKSSLDTSQFSSTHLAPLKGIQAVPDAE